MVDLNKEIEGSDAAGVTGSRRVTVMAETRRNRK